ncbi:MAG: hypothetical protein C0631_12725 [Sedimenticola sp.]|jgi:hypothetical protein|nr:hypothetical protein [Sedimenticola sp.]PLY13884.1 MAG: hypothetical protein C0631_12725 [Sedimenticola sp.]
MKRINKLLKKVAMILFAAGLISVGIIAIWVILMASIIASAVFLFTSGGKWFQQPRLYRLDECKYRSQDAAT